MKRVFVLMLSVALLAGAAMAESPSRRRLKRLLS